MSDWFNVDRAGLAAILERRGKSFAVFELIQNAWDATGVTRVDVELSPIESVPFARLLVRDDSPEGWANLDDAFTLFSRSRRAADPTKRGRFCLGEKMVLSLCRRASITTLQGSIIFDGTGRRRSNTKTTEKGTVFDAEIRMTRDELDDTLREMSRLIPPVSTYINGSIVERAATIGEFAAKLPTVATDDDGNLRPSVRLATVIVSRGLEEGPGEILEMGIPVCAADWPWRLNVMQKVPLGLDRDNVTDAFRRALQVAAVNAMSASIDGADASQPWATEAMADARITREAVQQLVVKRFGDRAVIHSPGDPIANATAEAAGATVIHGGSLPAGAWANVRKHELVPAASRAFPTARPVDQGTPTVCPMCKQPVR